MTDDDYVEYAQIAAAFPRYIEWSLEDLLKLGRQTQTPLPFIRKGNRLSTPMWRIGSLTRWFARTYRHSPRLVSEFTEKLKADAAPKMSRCNCGAEFRKRQIH